MAVSLRIPPLWADGKNPRDYDSLTGTAKQVQSTVVRIYHLADLGKDKMANILLFLSAPTPSARLGSSMDRNGINAPAPFMPTAALLFGRCEITKILPFIRILLRGLPWNVATHRSAGNTWCDERHPDLVCSIRWCSHVDCGYFVGIAGGGEYWHRSVIESDTSYTSNPVSLEPIKDGLCYILPDFMVDGTYRVATDNDTIRIAHLPWCGAGGLLPQDFGLCPRHCMVPAARTDRERTCRTSGQLTEMLMPMQTPWAGAASAGRCL